MRVHPTTLPGVLLIEPRRIADARGFFMESWSERVFAEHGINATFVQDNHSRSRRDVVRGLHYQVGRPQGKLVRVSAGAVFDVAVDLRPGSAGFGRWTGHVLSADNAAMMWIPPGFAHGFLCLEDGTDLLYKCTDYYAPEGERTIAWDDPMLAIDWPLGGRRALLSAKDADAPRLAACEVYA
ncbi:dTDP-4-dehydrorhamnose 3,5-epimerase [Hephaestia sp. GCM10023244]|uniref:dTDP-4-dehydrorhamnose 3,5-epimerase n=1 Tax=unclassified Hephaestia TaxID=2631281 RepID=UPI0020773D29|nr:dTDP-4-dehydrorhamnose 3,5-epimerase [Hephaestia sp. MAHUQ-44]MCM8729774.1 dTDP-4-dehydrorhamnose 3,5-epimerase [Hephaestia sp. MAHUQ-44]